MTGLLAFVPSTAQSFRARQRAYVLNVNATHLVALVLAAGALLCTLLLAASIISLSRQFCARELLIHVTTAAFNLRAKLAFGTIGLVAVCLADMRVTCK